MNIFTKGIVKRYYYIILYFQWSTEKDN